MASVISIDFDAPFDVQAAQARAQGVVLPEYYYGLLPAEKRKYAQTVSSLAGLDQIQTVVDKLAEWQAEGKTLAEFKKWAKTQDWTLPNGRLETIYRNSVQTAYQAGHWRDFEENKDERPYLMYDAINDSRVRPSHMALDNTIKPVDDPFWNTHSPPLGHRCRCSIRSLSQREAMKHGGVTQNVPIEGGPDEGWGSKPTEWGKVLERLKSEKLARLGDDVVQEAYDRAMRSEEIAIRTGDLKEPALSDVQRQARDYVVSNGIRTGHEYGAAIADDEIFERFTSGMPNALQVPDFPEFNASAVEVHHNHPTGDSLSAQDFVKLLSNAAINTVIVHGHSGFFAQATQIGASISGKDAYIVSSSMKSKAKSLVSKAALSGEISPLDAQSGLWPVVMALLFENDGLIRYTSNSDALLELAKKVIRHGN